MTGPQSSSNRINIFLRLFMQLSPSRIAKACLSSFRLNGLELHITHPKILLARSRSLTDSFSFIRFTIRPYLDRNGGEHELARRGTVFEDVPILTPHRAQLVNCGPRLQVPPYQSGFSGHR